MRRPLPVVRVGRIQFLRRLFGTGTVGITEGGVGHAAVVLVPGETENRIAARRVAGDGQDVAVVRGDEDERLRGIGHSDGRGDGVRKGDGVGQCPVGVAGVVRVIDPSPLDHQKEARFVLQPLDGEPGHLRQRRFAAGIPGPIRLVLHVRTLEQAEHLARIGERVEPWAVVHEAAVGTGGEPFGDQIAAVQASAGLVGVLRVGRGYR